MKKVILIGLFFILLYTRFVGLDWGLPYPMHPDERNMANAIQGLNCEILNSQFQISNCFNPHFFAYGQLPLYLGYLLIQIYHLLIGRFGQPISFLEAVMSLRLISAAVSVINALVLVKIMQYLVSAFFNQKFLRYTLHVTSYTIFIFQPYFIQFSRFGTTESLLILFYSLIIYFSLQLFNKLRFDRSKLEWKTIFLLSLFSGLAVATKISSLIFIPVVLIAIFINHKSTSIKKSLSGSKIINHGFLRYTLHVTRFAIIFLVLTILFTFLFSPHNLISWPDFVGTIKYESAIATGAVKIFYTRQFEGTAPVWFQLAKIFPYALGWPQYLLAVFGFFCLSWRRKEINLLRFAFLAYFIPNSLLYAKWTRFMAPIFPVMSIFAVLFIISILRYTLHVTRLAFGSPRRARFALLVLIFAVSIPGLTYLSIYQNPDVRFTASEWIYKNIPHGSYVLSETANVVDIPIENQNYRHISFNFYDLDRDIKLQEELKDHLVKADYILVPSRRIFRNHPPSQYPGLNDYYQKLFSGELGFKKVAEFTSYPKISFFGKTLFEFPDENAEETWSVFDHPVVRIYKRI